MAVKIVDEMPESGWFVVVVDPVSIYWVNSYPETYRWAGDILQIKVGDLWRDHPETPISYPPETVYKYIIIE